MGCPKKPKIDWLDKLRFIRHYAVNGCSTTLQIYVETFTQADTNLVLGIVNTSPEDFTRFLLRPKGARTMRHGIRSLSTNEAAAEDELIPDTAKLAADTIHEVTGWHVPTWGEFGDALFDIAKPIIGSLYYLLLANVTEDFAFDWYSGILLQPESKCGIGRFFAGAEDNPDGSYAYQQKNLLLGGVHTINVHQFGKAVSVGSGVWCLVFDINVYNNPGRPQWVEYWVQMKLGALLQTICGDPMHIEIKEDQDHVHKRYVRKVDGEDAINLWFAAFWHGPPGFEVRIDVQLGAFMI